ncbi:MAG TPA: flagellin [Stellaceae bacterium]|nr:flagellin [Stellaceae bacterium]
MSNIVLGTATQQNLLALQNVDNSLTTTQNALSTGLKVSSAVDDAVKYFESQSLDNRANDLSTRKDAIDQGISSVTTATQGIQSAISILQQLQGIVQSAKTETAAERASAGTQFTTLATQLNSLLNDTSYQGLNLVNSSATSLALQFSQSTASTLTVAGQNLLVSVSISSDSAASKIVTTLAGAKFSAVSNATSHFDAVYTALNNSISTFQAAAQSLGSNVSFLQTRLQFTEQYITTLQGGASKLTVADVNQESTNLVTLQTRQQLAIQSLSIATQSEQAVLRLFH